MAGTYPTLGAALRGVGARNLWPRATWVAALAAKVPAYSLNWVAYQRLRRAELRRTRGRTPTPARDVFLGACAASISVCVMIPLDTVKVRMTTGNLGLPYAHVGEAIGTMLRTEGVLAFYRGLPPRLLSVVPMTALQFAAYEFGKRAIPRLEADAAATWARLTGKV
ncbi:hypothetical protein AURANDRAFT_69122, partial [Aureococcus anophagefferens]